MSFEVELLGIHIAGDSGINSHGSKVSGRAALGATLLTCFLPIGCSATLIIKTVTFGFVDDVFIVPADFSILPKAISKAVFGALSLAPMMNRNLRVARSHQLGWYFLNHQMSVLWVLMRGVKRQTFFSRLAGRSLNLSIGLRASSRLVRSMDRQRLRTMVR